MQTTNHPMVDALKAEAKNNPVFRDVCHMFSLRQRTRGRLTVTRLKQAMEAEGFNYSRKQYEDVLNFMGKIGIGQLDLAKRGKVKSLNNIKIKLQSIGNAALDQTGALQRRHEINRYQNLVPSQPINTVPVQNEVHKQDFIETVVKRKPGRPAKTAPIAVAPVVTAPKNAPVRAEEPYPVFLTMILDGKLINIPGPKGVTAENIGEFIVDFKKLAKKQDLDV